jgi:hypothetical protein
VTKGSDKEGWGVGRGGGGREYAEYLVRRHVLMLALFSETMIGKGGKEARLDGNSR